MFHRKIVYTSLFLLLLLTAILGGIIFYQKNNQKLEVVFLDVGQGDAILVSQGSQQVLIDGGRDGKLLLNKLGKYIPFWDRQIEAVIMTHPDADHIGGLADVLESYRVNLIIKTGDKSGSQTYKFLEESIDTKNTEEVEARKGMNINFQNGAQMEILFPLETLLENFPDNNSNAGSVVAKLTFGENKFLFTGDLPGEQEKTLIGFGADLKSTVLKVSHHGSKYSTAEEFLVATQPEDVIISAGKNNTYGHPAPEIIERLMNKGIKIFRTDEMGDMAYQCKNQNEKCKIGY